MLKLDARRERRQRREEKRSLSWVKEMVRILRSCLSVRAISDIDSIWIRRLRLYLRRSFIIGSFVLSVRIFRRTLIRLMWVSFPTPPFSIVIRK
jgi:hypothetical protein